jgi:alpha-1,2-mannosyltransferase
MNQQEFTRYIPEPACDYLIDLDLPHQSEKHYAQLKDEWELVTAYPFLDSTHSRAIYRTFYVPHLSQKHNSYAQYQLLRRRPAAVPSSPPTHDEPKPAHY